jgi:hypothetical protein
MPFAPEMTMNAPVRTSVFAFVSCLLIACGGASADGSVDPDATSDTNGSGSDAALDTSGDGGAADGGDEPDAMVPDADTSTSDVSPEDAADSDTTVPDADSGTDTSDDADGVADTESDVADTDVAEGDTTDIDAEADAGTDAVDDTETDASPVACEFIDLDIRILDCNGDYKYLRGWTAPFDESGTCVPYFTISGDETQYATADEAINTTDCSADCQYVASTSVSWLYCGRRSGYIIYRDADERCGDLYEMPEGIYTSLEAHAAENPCAP